MVQTGSERTGIEQNEMGHVRTERNGMERNKMGHDGKDRNRTEHLLFMVGKI